MGTLASQSGMSSTTPSVSDLDGFTFRDYSFPSASNFPPAQDDEFGFDPPQMKSSYINSYQTYSPPADISSDWPGFERDDDTSSITDKRINLDAFEIDNFMPSSLLNTNNAISRHGQMTPPRSNSAESTESKDEKPSSPTSPVPERRKRAKVQPKVESSPPLTTTTKTSTAGRKRKSMRKSSSVDGGGEALEENKRKQSLEKNRVAAAKCRINKKEKTEKLQRDSHDKAVENAVLKSTVMQLKDMVQQLNAVVIAHINGCEGGCNSPEEIRAHLQALGNDFFNQPMMISGHNLGDLSSLNFPEMSAMPGNYFSSTSSGSILNPPLPEFDRSADFEVHTPLHGD